MTEVWIDPNVRADDNTTFAGLEDIHGPVPAVGDAVVAREPESNVVWDATVAGFADRDLIFLAVDWTSGREDQPPSPEEFMETYRKASHTWECLNRTRIGFPAVDACDCGRRMRMAEMPEAWADLIKALTIMSRHPTSKTRVTGCSHDVLYVCADDEKFTAEEIDELDRLGFMAQSDGGFISFKYGSC